MVLNKKDIIDIINKITFKTLGCTEPIAIALAAAVAYKEIGGKIKAVKIVLDKNVYKNAMAVGIPGTIQKGPKTAIALGLVCGDPSKGLLLLENVDKKDISKANKLLTEDLINISVNDSASSLYIKAEIETEQGFAKAIIEQCHDNIILIEKNGEIIYHRISNSENGATFLDEYNFEKIDIALLINIIKSIPIQKFAFLKQGYILNKKAAKIGIKKCSGMALGAGYKKLMEKMVIEDNFINQTKMLVAGAVDARMGGIKIPIFGCAGSGNHGIAFFLTTGMCFQHFKVRNSLQLHAYALGLVILAAIKQNLGLLSSVCGGVIAAGAAAASAITYALGGNVEQIINAINLIIGNISGMVCDGAKSGCALKIATGSILAVEAALLSISNVCIPNTDGIVGEDFTKTVTNLGLLNKQGMWRVEDTVLEILKKKNK